MTPPRPLRPTRVLLPLALALGLGGCISGASPASRYFRPIPPDAEAPAEPEAAAPDQRLRLRPVTAADYLGERIVWRLSDVEVGFYDLRRWAEPPARLVEAALARRLFEELALERSTGSTAPALDVHVRAFEEVLAPEHEVRVALRVWLLAPETRAAVLERTVTATRPVSGEDAPAAARALGAALDAAVERVGEAVARALEEP